MIQTLQLKRQQAHTLLRSRLGKNSFLAIVQAIVSAISMFAAYHLMLREVGLEKLGLWSALMAGTATARFMDLSGSGGLSRFVAQCQSRNDHQGMVFYIHTTLCATLVFNLIAATLVYFFATPLVQYFVDLKWSAEVHELLPLALLVSVVLPATTSAICSAIDGTQRTELRAYCNIVASIVFVIAAWQFIPQHGVFGYGIALVVQQITLWVLSWTTLKTLVQGLGWFPRKLSKAVFKTTFVFGIQIQVNSLASLLSEPLAKLMLASWGGLTALGYYELASRLVFQAKGLFVAGIQPLMPAMASMSDVPEQRNTLLIRAIKLAVVCGLVIFTSLILIGPIFSMLMLQKIDQHLLIMIVVLALGSSINMFSVPLYFASMAAGVMKWNIFSQTGVAISVFAAGLLFGKLWGSNSIIGGIVAGLVLGSLVCYFGNARALRVTITLRGLNDMLLKASIALLMLTFIVIWLINHVAHG
jgi:O-antigen/teichoic acid export membrane protein